MLNRIKQSPQLLLAGLAGLLAAFVTILVLISSLSPTSSGNKTSSPTEAAGITTAPNKLSYKRALDQAYKTPQGTFSNERQSLVGTLTVSADPDGTSAIIDPPPDAYAEAPLVNPTNKRVPLQSPPFVAKGIPVGSHKIIVSKPGYIAKTSSFVIRANKNTKIYLKLELIK